MALPVFGFLQAGGNSSPEGSEDEDDEEDELLDMRDITGVASGADILEGSSVRRSRKYLRLLKWNSGMKEIDNSYTLPMPVHGPFPLVEPWWQVETVLGPQQRGHLERKTQGYPYYSLRDDKQADASLLAVFLLHLFYWWGKAEKEINKKAAEAQKNAETSSSLEGVDDVGPGPVSSQSAPPKITALKTHRDFMQFAKSCSSWSKLLSVSKLDELLIEMGQNQMARELRSLLDLWPSWGLVKLAVIKPGFFRLFSKIFPRHIARLVSLHDHTLEELECAMETQPWVFGFREILYNRYSVCGMEASLKNLQDSELWEKIPPDKVEALKLYDALQKNCKNFGNTWCRLLYMPKLLHEKLLHFEVAMQYLVEERVFVQEENCIMLYGLWKAESGIANCLTQLHRGPYRKPLWMDVDLSSPEFASINADPDQRKAVEVLCKQNVVVLSGKGGCGKTSVVSTVFRPKRTRNNPDGAVQFGVVMPQKGTEELGDDGIHPFEESEDDFSMVDGVAPVSSYQTATFPADVFSSSSQTSRLPAMELTPVKGIMPPSPEVSGVRHLFSTKKSSSPLTIAATVGFTPVKRALDSLSLNSPCRKGIASSSKGTPVKRRLLQDAMEGGYASNMSTDVAKANSETKSTNQFMPYEEFREKLTCVAVKIGDPPKSPILLTAPTGKAANLLGKRSDIPAYTLHQVIYSYYHWSKRSNDGSDAPWHYSATQVLIVDECSLVPVTVFYTLLELLKQHASLEKVVLLGDILQLPSVQPGNFLEDVWNAMSDYDCCVTLTHNHRAGSELLVANAGRISEGRFPEFDEQNMFSFVRILSEQSEPDPRKKQGTEYVNFTQAIQCLLNEDPHLKDHTVSQFVAFRRLDCKAINETCCKHYSKHSLNEKTNGKEKRIFQVGDKICMLKNGKIPCQDLVLEELRIAQQMWRNKLNYVKSPKKDLKMNNQQGGTRIKERQVAVALEASSRPIIGQQPTPAVTNSSIEERGLQSAEDLCDIYGSCDVNDKESLEMEICGMDLNTKDTCFPEARLCNGEIFYITEDHTVMEESSSQGKGKQQQYLTLYDPDTGRCIKAELRHLRQRCKMEHSWARTIHTFQGSEIPTVVYVVGNDCKVQTWQHVYTAVTRGKERVYIISSQSILKNTVQRIPKARMTTLSRRLSENLKTSSAEEASQFIKDQTASHTENGQCLGDLSPDVWVDDFSVDEASRADGWTQLKPMQPAELDGFQSHQQSDSLPWNSDNEDELVQASQTTQCLRDPSPDVWVDDFSGDEATQQSGWTQRKPLQPAYGSRIYHKSDSMPWNSDNEDELVQASQAAEAYL